MIWISSKAQSSKFKAQNIIYIILKNMPGKNQKEKQNQNQQDDKKKSIIFFILTFLLLVIVGALLYFLFFYDFSAKKDLTPKEQEKNTPALPKSPDKQGDEDDDQKEVNGPVTEEQSGFNDSADFSEADLKKLASSFAERFGSYSNHSQYDNLKDLKLFMSEDMNSWAENYIDEQLQKDYSGEYYGISTKAVSSKIDNFDKSEGEAKVTVQTQRIESEGGKDKEKVIYQDIVIDFIKEGGKWKVDEAKWK